MSGTRRAGGTKAVVVVLVALLVVVGAGVCLYPRVLGPTLGHPLAEYLPEQTLAYVSVAELDDVYRRQLDAIRADYPQVDQDMERVIDKTLALVEQGTGLTSASLKAALSKVRTVDLAALRVTRGGVQVVALVDAADPLAGWGLYKEVLDKGLIEEAETYEGYTLYRYTEPLSRGQDPFHLYLGLLDKRLLATIWTDAAPLREVIAATVRPLERNLAKDPTYARLATKLAGRSYAWTYVGSRPVIETVRSMGGEDAIQSLQATEPVAGWSLLEAATLAGRMQGDRDVGSLDVHTTGATPWFEAFHTPPTPRRLLDGLPAGAAAAVDLGLGDCEDLWRRIQDYIRAVIRAEYAGRYTTPQRAEERAAREIENMEEALRDEFPREMGFRIEGDLAPALGDEVCVAFYPADPIASGRGGLPFSLVVLARVRDPIKARGVEAGFREVGLRDIEWDRSTHGTATVQTAVGNERGSQPNLAYALTDELLIVSTRRDLVVASLDAAGGGAGFARNEDVRAVLAQAPGNASALLVADTGAYMELMAAIAGGDLPFDLSELRPLTVAVSLVEDPRRTSLTWSAPLGGGWGPSTARSLEDLIEPLARDLSMDARHAAVQGTLGAVRAGISNFYGKMALPSMVGAPRYPTFAELVTPGTVMNARTGIPANPYSTLPGQAATVLDANAEGKSRGQSKNGTDAAEGWYYRATTGEFWPATETGKGF